MTRIELSPLSDFIDRLFQSAQAAPEVAAVTTRVLVQGDRLGQHTHGVKLARGYLRDLRSGHASADPARLRTLKSAASIRLYDAGYLLGPCVMDAVLGWATEAARTHGVAVANVSRSHHIACLGAYLKQATDQNLVCLIMCSDPAVASVAPYGGTRALYTPNPLAVGIPGEPDPVLIDVSMSSITNGMVQKRRALGQRLDHPVILAADGSLSDDPAALSADPPGTILPLGGMAYGHKGYALGLMVEAMTSGLGGHGRKDRPQGWGASVHVQVIDPDFLGGVAALKAELAVFAQGVADNPPLDPARPPRLPGAQGMRNWRRAEREGVVLPEDVIAELRAAAQEAGLPYPF
ncbi:Ldh family oxidoreductase [Orrella sp. JC864]|uniref:Ldh family oxidoreductase n=1 Tax=Orrella sp. JC864 TaxID=3120298 RepID=UPI0030092659